MHNKLPGLIAALLLSLAGPLAAEPAQPLEVIRLAVPDASAGRHPSSGTPTIDYAYTQKLFEQEFAKDGIEIQWAFFKNAGPAINEAFANEQIDVAFLGDLAAIIGEAVGNSTRLLAATSRGLNGYLGVVPGSGNDSLESLRGKTIGVWLGTAGHLSLEAMLASRGYSDKDFHLISLDNSAGLAALAAKRIDAVWSAAGVLALRNRGLAEIPLSTQGGDGTGTIAVTMLGASDFVERHPAITERLVRVLVQAAHWSSRPENGEAAVDLLVKQIGLPPELMAQELQGEPLSRRNSPLLDDYFLKHLQYGADAAYAKRLIRSRVDVQNWAEPRFLDQALAELQLTDYWPQREAYVDPWH
ncbi:ABC transporter substrate-binding protein [Pseudomonas sp. ML96]|uniref:ABC transporter substrate-binding protein n=1 Tax=Pseudomonas sp. ML96 TaxID=1523503 RepID=UPI00069051D3|nr:ABC transporter substrate-binding protein [Pseudomonas sp. ML96]